MNIRKNHYESQFSSSASQSDSEYVVDSRDCRPTMKCKRKALKKMIKLIHGRCVVIYRGTGDLLSIAARDADRHGYCDFVFICHDTKPIASARPASVLSRSRSAMESASSSNENLNLFTLRQRIEESTCFDKSLL